MTVTEALAEVKDPKHDAGSKKVSTFFTPKSALLALAQAMQDGAHKYGPYNWRETSVSTSTYLAAIDRHLMAWTEREETAEDSGIHHLGHAMASLAILIDAQLHGVLVDDRPKSKGEFVSLLKAVNEFTAQRSA